MNAAEVVKELSQLGPERVQELIDWLDGDGPKPLDALAMLPDPIRRELELAAAEPIEPP